MKKVNLKIMVVFLTILLFSTFLIFNIFAFNKNKDVFRLNKNTTTNVVMDSSNENLIDDKLVVNGKEKDIKVLEVVSHLGFSIRYQDSMFSLTRLSNGAYKFSLINDENNYVLIDKLQEKEYYKAYKELNSKEYIKNNYLISYKFLKGNVLTFLKITKSVNVETQEYEEINANLDYMISSLTLTS